MQTGVLSSGRPNVLMCRYVCELLPPTCQGLLRSAGSVGYNAFEELVELGDVPAYVEVYMYIVNLCQTTMRAPVRVSMRYKREPLPDYNFQDHARYPLVLSHSALVKRGIVSPLSCKGVGWKTLYWESIRYDCGGDGNGSIPLALLTELPNMRNVDFCLKNRCPHINARLPGGLLSLCPRLSTVNTTTWCNVTSIESCVLTQNPLLKHINLSLLGNVTFIGDCFLWGCIGLVSLDLSIFTKVVQIGTKFIASCRSLTDIITTITVQSVPPLKGELIQETYTSSSSSQPSSPPSPPIHPLHLLSQIPKEYMMGCSTLTSINLSPFSNVVRIDNRFLFNCRKLTSVNLTALTKVTHIGAEFLGGCAALTSVDLSPFRSSLATIGEGFLAACEGLTALDTTPLEHITHINSCFLDECCGLEMVDLGGLRNVSSVDTPFMSGCLISGSTLHIDLSPLINIPMVERRKLIEKRVAGMGTVSFE